MPTTQIPHLGRAIALATGALAVACTTAPSAQPASPTPPPAHVLATPVLITVKGSVSQDRPRAYVFFRLSKHLHEPRLIVAQVKGNSGRTYAVRDKAVTKCYKSALLLQGGTTGRLRAGHSYRVSFVARSTAHESTSGKTPFATYTLKAQSRPLVHGTVSAACPT